MALLFTNYANREDFCVVLQTSVCSRAKRKLKFAVQPRYGIALYKLRQPRRFLRRIANFSLFPCKAQTEALP
jgi:hypothetical protein